MRANPAQKSFARASGFYFQQAANPDLPACSLICPNKLNGATIIEGGRGWSVSQNSGASSKATPAPATPPLRF